MFIRLEYAGLCVCGMTWHGKGNEVNDGGVLYMKLKMKLITHTLLLYDSVTLKFIMLTLDLNITLAK